MSTETTISGITSKPDVHQIGIEYVTEKLTDYGISTKFVNGRNIDFILNNGETILVRANSVDCRPLIKGSLENLKSDYLIIVTNLESINDRKIYIMAMNDAKKIAIDLPDKYGKSDFIISSKDCQQYENNYDIVTNSINISIKKNEEERIAKIKKNEEEEREFIKTHNGITRKEYNDKIEAKRELRDAKILANRKALNAEKDKAKENARERRAFDFHNEKLMRYGNLPITLPEFRNLN